MGSEPILISSQVELQTLIFGWYMYDQLWKILQDTGLAFLPFLGMIISHFFEPITATYTTSAAQLSLKRMEWNLLRMLIVIVLAGQPFMDISLSNYKLLNLCEQDENGHFIDLQTLRTEAKAIEAKRSTNPISYTDTDPAAKKATVPLWWYAVMSVATGFTEAAKASVPCVNDFREILAKTLGGTAVTGTDSLNAEIQAFINLCHNHAAAGYNALHDKNFGGADPIDPHAIVIKNAIESAEKGDFSQDITQIGSIFFRGVGARTNDASISGWVGEKAAKASALAGEGRFYDKLVEIYNWNADNQTRWVSCRQWWGMGDTSGFDDEGNIARTTGVGRLLTIAQFVQGSKNNRFKTSGVDVDMPTEEGTDVDFSVMRQLGFRIWVLLAVKTGIVHYTSRQSGTGYYVSAGDYSDLALDRVIAAYKKVPSLTFNVVKVKGDSWTTDTLVEDLIDWYGDLPPFGGSPALGAIYAREQIHNYIKENIINATVISSTAGGGEGGAGYMEKIKRGIGTFGLTIAALGTYMTAYVARTSFPYVQALLLCGVYLFLAVGLVFAGYSLEFMYAGAMAIFTLKFMAFIFYLCAWLDNNLLVLVTGETLGAAISRNVPAWGTQGLSYLLLGPIGPVALTIGGVLKGMYDNVEMVMVDYATAGLYFTLPSLFATVMAWAGVKGAEAIGEMQKAQQPMIQAGQQGAQIAQKLAAGAISGGVGGAASYVGGKAAGGSGLAGAVGGGAAGYGAAKIAGRFKKE